MKKIAICTLNSKYVHGSLAPWCLLSGVKEYCSTPVEAEVVEGTINQPQEEMLGKIVSGAYDFVGFSCYIWNITQTEAVVSALKKRCPQLPIVLGGPEVSFQQKEVLERCKAVDFVLSGEGEKPFAQLVEAVFGERAFADVQGLSYYEGEEIRVNPSYFPSEEPPSPYCEAYLTQLQGKISYMESSRGCPYACAFCLSGQDKGVRFFEMARVKQDIVFLANSGTKTIKFVDRTFNANASHANEILSFILKQYGKEIPTTVCFHFEMAGDILKESTLNLIEKMPKGYVQLEIGMQSFCEKTLEAVGRKTNISLLTDNIKKLVSFGNHHLHIDLIAGLPYEEMEEFKKSFNIGYLLGASMLQLGFLKVLQGSEIGLFPEKYPCEYEKTPPYQVISTPWLSEAEFEVLDRIEDCVDRLYNSGRFARSLQYLLEATNWTPFDLLAEISSQLQFEGYPSLDAYVDAIFAITQGFSGVDSVILRDRLMLDRIETNSTGNIPKSLMIQDKQLRQLKIALEQQPETACPKGGKRFVGILYSENRGVYVDYPKKSEKHSHFQEKYQVHFVSLDLIQREETADS